MNFSCFQGRCLHFARCVCLIAIHLRVAGQFWGSGAIDELADTTSQGDAGHKHEQTGKGTNRRKPLRVKTVLHGHRAWSLGLRPRD